MDFIDQCRTLIAIDSSLDVGTKESTLYLKNLCEQSGLFTELIADVHLGQEQLALVASASPIANLSNTKNLMLQSYIDTQNPGPFGSWQMTNMNPFNAQVVDGKLFGLGVAEGKVDFLCKLEAYRRLTKNGWKQETKTGRNFSLVATYGRSSGMAGAMKLIRRKLIRADRALVSARTGLAVANEGMGEAHVELKINFSSEEKEIRHAHNQSESSSSQSRFFKADSESCSLEKALRYLAKLPTGIVILELDGGVNFSSPAANALLEIEIHSNLNEPMAEKLLQFYAVFQSLQNEMRQFSTNKDQRPTLKLGAAKTSDDSIVISGISTIPPTVTHEVYQNWMREIEKVALKINAEFKLQDYKRPYQTPIENPFVEQAQSVIQSLGLPGQLGRQDSINEASLWSRLGIHCISFGAGFRNDKLSLAEQSIPLENLEKAISFYMKMLELNV